jgi:solute carrier family 6 amino acid transporter-like protein 5/7/9/14
VKLTGTKDKLSLIQNFVMYEIRFKYSCYVNYCCSFYSSGLGFGQMFCTVLVLTYYCSLMALTTFYFVQSFAADLPWSTCNKDWDMCSDSRKTESNISEAADATSYKSSSELYF